MSQQIPELERITFFNGQQLTADDLSALQRANRELRWLHNRSLHRWGIGLGLDVTGQKGDSAVTISPGYGVDCLGREIILTETVTKTVPAVGAGDGSALFFLVASYQEDAEQKVLARRRGVCSSGGAVRLSEEPLIDWRKAAQLMPGHELILAQASIRNCQLSEPLSLAVRRYARPAHQPYIATGRATAKETAWQTWMMGPDKIGVSAVIDTSAAHFKTTPRYLAHITGERVLTTPPGPLMAFGVPAVEWAQPGAFMLQVLLPKFPGMPQINPDVLLDVSGTPTVIEQLNWQVVWMGIEG